jgi:AraC-like DNA-binding protein
MQHWTDPDLAPRPVVVLAERYDAGEGHWHAHRRAQLIHASIGVLTVHTEQGLWVVPPQRGVWILPRTPHRVASPQCFWLRTLYAEPDAAPVPPECCVVGIDSLVGELLIAASGFGVDYEPNGPEQRLIQVILDRLPSLQVAPQHLPRPSDPRLRRIADLLAADPADPRTLDTLAGVVGVTVRTAARLFRKETGLSFMQWRQQLRLLRALERFGEGHSVTTVALEVGYADLSSFIKVFKAAFGATPARYFAPVAAEMTTPSSLRSLPPARARSTSGTAGRY